jgi:hypothetical protein
LWCRWSDEDVDPVDDHRDHRAGSAESRLRHFRSLECVLSLLPAALNEDADRDVPRASGKAASFPASSKPFMLGICNYSMASANLCSSISVSAASAGGLFPVYGAQEDRGLSASSAAHQVAVRKVVDDQHLVISRRQ